MHQIVRDLLYGKIEEMRVRVAGEEEKDARPELHWQFSRYLVEQPVESAVIAITCQW
jgi:hypothetical protein